MNFRGTVTGLDRFLASLPYSLLLFSVLPMLLLRAVLFLGMTVTSPAVSPEQAFWDSILATLGALLGPYIRLIFYLGLYLLMVRNRTINYFIRFHVMQSLLIGIAAPLVGLVLNFLGPALGALTDWLELLVSLAVAGASMYSFFCVIMGNYGSIPVISEAVESQLRF